MIKSKRSEKRTSEGDTNICCPGLSTAYVMKDYNREHLKTRWTTASPKQVKAPGYWPGLTQNRQLTICRNVWELYGKGTRRRRELTTPSHVSCPRLCQGIILHTQCYGTTWAMSANLSIAQRDPRHTCRLSHPLWDSRSIPTQAAKQSRMFTPVFK